MQLFTGDGVGDTVRVAAHAHEMASNLEDLLPRVGRRVKVGGRTGEISCEHRLLHVL